MFYYYPQELTAALWKACRCLTTACTERRACVRTRE